MKDNDSETLAESNKPTRIRKMGTVHGLTIPSDMMALEVLKKAKGQKKPIRIVRRGNSIILEIPLSVSFNGRILEVNKE